jgi:hypothetical protein
MAFHIDPAEELGILPARPSPTGAVAMFSGRGAEAAASYRALAASSWAAGADVRALVSEHSAAQALCYTTGPTRPSRC